MKKNVCIKSSVSLVLLLSVFYVADSSFSHTHTHTHGLTQTNQSWVQVQATVLKPKSKYLDIFQVQVQSLCHVLKYKYMSLYLSTSIQGKGMESGG